MSALSQYKDSKRVSLGTKLEEGASLRKVNSRRVLLEIFLLKK